MRPSGRALLGRGVVRSGACQTEVRDAQIERHLRRRSAAAVPQTAQRLAEIDAGSRGAQGDIVEQLQQRIVDLGPFDSKLAASILALDCAPEASGKIADKLQQRVALAEHGELYVHGRQVYFTAAEAGVASRGRMPISRRCCVTEWASTPYKPSAAKKRATAANAPITHVGSPTPDRLCAFTSAIVWTSATASYGSTSLRVSRTLAHAAQGFEVRPPAAPTTRADWEAVAMNIFAMATADLVSCPVLKSH